MRRKYQLLFPLISVLLCFTGSSFAQNWSGIIAPSRAIDWSGAGVSGGIPARTTKCATLSAGATLAQINSAISSCPAGQTVFLNAGTYNLSGGIVINSHDNVTLRGAGADQTFLAFSNDDGCHGMLSDVCMESSDLNWKGGPANLANWTSGYAKGTTSIVLSAVPNLKVGNPIILDQADDTSDSGGIMVSDSNASGGGGPFSLEGNGGGAQRSGRQQAQIVTVTGCGGVTTAGAACSGSNVAVTISPGLYMPNWRSSQTPQAWWATSPLHGVGIESLSLDHTNSSSSAAGIEIFNCLGCWVSGVRDIDTGRAHVQILLSIHVTVRDSYFFLTKNSVSQSYGVECFACSDALVENNVFQAVVSPQMMNGTSTGTVIGYNFSVNDYYTASSGYSLPSAALHTAGIDNVLFEGNVGDQLHGDLFHGTHHFVTAFRNRWSGTQPACWISGSPYSSATFGACNNNLSAVAIDSFSRFFNFVGNILGTAGVNKNYDSGSTSVFDIGGGDTEGSVSIGSDPNVRTTLLRWGNYDTVTGSAKFDSSEMPSSLSGAQAPYSNPVPGSQTLPASFYYSTKPGWWPSAKAWPPIGPDVSGGNIANVGGHAFTIPAQDCFLNVMNGKADGTGPVSSFNAGNCYGSGGSVGNPPANAPNPPTGLNATVS
jgi:hypothetical protein